MPTDELPEQVYFPQIGEYGTLGFANRHNYAIYRPADFLPVAGYKAESAMQNVLDEVRAERERQDAKWGEQNHEPFTWLAILGEEVGEANQGALNAHFSGKSWDNYREELIQVAAVAVAMIESFDRNKNN